ncbi:MAG: 3-hydroxyacyl-CoA dehydrogenase NAD-binding domain-containing protein [Pirellulales bacterium]
MPEINKVAVIGAGVMGAGIAAQVANAGIPVVLLDIVPSEAQAPNAKDRNVIATGAIQRLLKTSPAPLMHPRNAKRITPGNIEDHLDLLADCDWIIEAVIERTEIKQDLYARIDPVRKAGSIVSSNTSTIPLETLVEGMPATFTQDFLITHFFNPPRYMRLLELVTGTQTRPDATQTLRAFADMALGKGVVDCNDTPGFIANRIGMLWIASAMRAAGEEGLSVEEADAVAGRPMGFPKTGIFALMDLVGLDLGPHIAHSMLVSLPADDPYRDIYQESELLKKMIAEGYTGRKGKGGFYRLNKTSGEGQSGGKKVKEAIDLLTGEYHPAVKPTLESIAAGKQGLRALVEHPDKGGRYAWKLLSQTLSYAASLVPEIADTVAQIDEAMRLGYAWKRGPFEMIDQLGPAWFADRLKQQGCPVPDLLKQVGTGTFYQVEDGQLQYFGTDGSYHPLQPNEGVLLLADVKRAAAEPVASNGSASLWDLGDRVLCLEFHSKMNSLDSSSLAMLGKALAIIPQQNFKALVIHNQATNFSVGANIGMALFAANIAAWSEIEEMTGQGQAVYKAMKYAPFPVVGAPSGMALGGGCEILLHCDNVQAHAETYMGLVEVGVGVIPGWGGCKEMLIRWNNRSDYYQGPMPGVTRVFETISMAKVSKSADEAKELLYLRPNDDIVMNQDRLLAAAKSKALELANHYQPPEEPELALPGPTAEVAFGMAVDDFHHAGKATEHDVVVSKALAHVLSGGDTDLTERVSEDDLLTLEREAFIGLVQTPATLDRIEHMLETGKPLRN